MKAAEKGLPLMASESISENDLSESNRRWIEVGLRVDRGEREGILCPKNQDDYMKVEWLPFKSGIGGEWWVHCPTCKAENFLLQREHVEPEE
jgi:hypothetical protein